VRVKVNDGAADSAPHNITVTVNPVNDLPVFASSPVTVANIGDTYEYLITVTDIDGDVITFPSSAPQVRPSWATLTVTSSDGKAKLSGIPTAGSAGTFDVKLRAKDPTGPLVEQAYTLLINTKPVLNSFHLATSEDTDINFQEQTFINAFTDADGNDLSKIKITVLPKHGSLRLNSNAVSVNDEITITSISQLIYRPNQDYFGKDTLHWNASDGLIYSNSDTFISFVINPVNDAPVITIESDTLKYEVGKDFIQLTSLFDVADVDDDSLVLAEVGFRQQRYKAGIDVITFANSANITGLFDSQSGVLTLSGKALRSEYVEVIRAIQYKYTNTNNPKLETKSIYITVSDGKSLSNTKDRFIEIIYTFQDLDILNAFTPNGDGFNDLWEVIKFKDNCNGDGLEPDPRRLELKESKTRIYNMSGRLIYEFKGFECENLWGGFDHGKPVPPGSYFYTIEAVDSKLKSLKKIYKGVVTVLHGSVN
jgi:gliding motility-associated-like protein